MGNLLEVLFPRICLGCGYVGAYICPSCESKMKRLKKSPCFYCNRASFLGFTHPNCRRKKGLDGHFSIYAYTGLFKKILHESKYKGAYLVLRTLLTFSQQNTFSYMRKWNDLYKPFITSVPLHAQRMRERGFNQSEIITKHLFNSIGFKSANLLERVINTDHLAHMENKERRRRHIRGAFNFIGTGVPEAALLIDDVITSGSTISECSKVLKEVGVQTVLAFSLAKG